MEDDGYKFVFAKHKIKEYVCSLCSNLLREAMELPCNHLNCQACLWKYQQTLSASAHFTPGNNEEEKYLCPTCKAAYSIDQIHPSPATDRILTNSLDVKCIWHIHGCTWNGTILKYHESHKTKCKFSTVKCAFRGCGKVVHRLEIDSHEESCSKRYSECRICNVHVDWKENRNHVCLVPCKNKGCNEKIDKDKLKDHMDNDCMANVLDCKYFRYGCLKQLPRGKMEIHEAKNCECLRLSMVKYEKYNDDFRDMQRKEKIIRSELPALEDERDMWKKKLQKIEKEWAEYEGSSNIVTTANGERKLVTMDDIKMLIQEKDFKTFMQYLCTCPSLTMMIDDKNDTLFNFAVKQKEPKFLVWLIGFAENENGTYKVPHGHESLAKMAVDTKCIKTAKVVLDFFPKLMRHQDLQGFTVVHQAVLNGDVEMLSYLCSRIDANVNIESNDGRKADDLNCVTKEMKKIIKHRRRCSIIVA